MFHTVWECLGGILAYLSDLSSQFVIVKQLPSVIRGIEEKEWTFDVGFDIDDFAIDPSQDLLMAIRTVSESYVIIYALYGIV